MSMTTYDELVARGLVAQVTDEDELKELINTGKAVFYIGFDATADSLHVGHFMFNEEITNGWKQTNSTCRWRNYYDR